MRLKDEDVCALDLPINFESLKEVDFSQNHLTSVGLESLKGILFDFACPQLQVLKLYRNELDDSSCTILCNVLEQHQTLVEMHLSHNRFTENGLADIIKAENSLENRERPFWLRVEGNPIL